MIINFMNRTFISKEAYIHDALFTGFSYDYENHQIKFKCKAYTGNVWFDFCFNNVFGFSMNSCELWGKGARVLDWELKNYDANSLTKRLIDLNVDGAQDFSRLKSPEFAVESKFTFTSGDTLMISCENIDFNKSNIPNQI